MSLATSKTYQRLPAYLRTFVVEQNYSKYTPREQATWRFIMRQARAFFKSHAHPVYLDGLRKTGIPISRIPDIEAMDEVLGRFGWGAVCVRGFIPPLAFLDFQARKVLPIAADMRSLEHMAYTPAPDIVHEAAGHAPIIADADYADYLCSYAQLARKAIFSHEDIRLYEAIRTLSDVKENPDSSAAVIAEAEEKLAAAAAGVTWVSEASKVARMNWWTVEYGLIGSLQEPQIYGAGLLSSLGESRSCLGAQVKKEALSLACIEQGYDITRPQPQLFVASSFGQLRDVLKELEATMAFQQGGWASLQLAKRAATVTSTQWDSGLTVTGVVDELLQNPASTHAEPAFVRWRGPVQLAYAGKQLPGHGRERHGHGFSAPFGLWQQGGRRNPAQFSDSELASMGLRQGAVTSLRFQSGFEVRGQLKGWLRHSDGTLLLLTWADCTVSLGDKVYFEPAWGEFDMAVGLEVPSVYGGPCDWEAYGDYDLGQASSSPARTSPFSANEQALFVLYAALRTLREAAQNGQKPSEGELAALAAQITETHPEEWLLGVELAELASQALGADWSKTRAWGQQLMAVLNAHGHADATAEFVASGLALATVPD